MGEFFVSLGINLLFRYKWLILALIALALSLIFHFSMIIVWIILGIWFLHGLLVTIILTVLSGIPSGTPTNAEQENKNPYSKSTKDLINMMKKRSEG